MNTFASIKFHRASCLVTLSGLIATGCIESPDTLVDGPVTVVRTGDLLPTTGATTALNPAARATARSRVASTGVIALSNQPERVIVAARDYAKARAAVLAAGGTIVLELKQVDAFAAFLSGNTVAALATHAAIDFIEKDQRRYPLSETIPYGITLTQANQVSDSLAANRTVCIIDSGYNLGHPDLPGTSQVSGTDDIAGAGPWNTHDGAHGTHVAGTIAALANNSIGVVGVNASGTVKLHIVRVFDDSGWAYSSSLIAAANVCAANGANVINMSLGGSFKSKTEEKGFNSLNSQGILSIAAAGNDGNTRKSYPASYNSVVSVAAIDSSENIASFSQQNSAVEIAAPGVGILSTVPTGTGLDTAFTVNGAEYAAAAMDESPAGNATGTLVNCGLGTSACPGGGGQVCLIQRGTITFSDKVLACQAGGGVAVVISNNEPGVLYGTMGGVTTTIPSVGVGQADGATLLGQTGTSATVALTASDYAAWDGTSMATPHVVGIAALIWSHNTNWTNDEIRNALQATAKDLGVAGKDNAYGYGLVQAKAALDFLQSGPSCTVTQTPETSCADGVDNDCDGATDAVDSDCAAPPGGCTLLSAGSSCSASSQCCSNNCKGKPGNKTCK